MTTNAIKNDFIYIVLVKAHTGLGKVSRVLSGDMSTRTSQSVRMTILRILSRFRGGGTMRRSMRVLCMRRAAVTALARMTG